MKTAAKVFLWLTLVAYAFLAFFLSIFLVFLLESGVFFLIFLVFALPIALPIIALGKVDKVKSKRELFAISILVLLFSDLLAGIFMLCITDEDLMKNKTRSGATYQYAPMHQTENAPRQTASTMQQGATVARPQTQNAPKPTSAPSIPNELAIKLNDSKIMLEDGILTEEEYKDIRKKIISDYYSK